jgi:hypothetical protein
MRIVSDVDGSQWECSSSGWRLFRPDEPGNAGRDVGQPQYAFIVCRAGEREQVLTLAADWESRFSDAQLLAAIHSAAAQPRLSADD